MNGPFKTYLSIMVMAGLSAALPAFAQTSDTEAPHQARGSSCARACPAPDTAEGAIDAQAANLYLDCLNAAGCFDEMAEAVELFADDSKPPGSHLTQDDELRRILGALKVQLERKRADTAFSDRRYLDAAETYLAIASDFPDWYDDQSRCELQFNAAVAFERSRLVGRAIAQYERLIERYPSCPHASKAALFIGHHYLALQLHEQAAVHNLEFARRYPAEPDAVDALEDAITLLTATGQHERALEAVELYEKNYSRKRPGASATIVFNAGYIHINDEDWKRVRDHYEMYLKRYSKARLVDEQIQAIVFIGDSYRLQNKPDLKRAREQYARATSLFDKGAMNAVDESKRRSEMLIATAKARYLLAMEQHDAFMGLELPPFEPRKRAPKKIRRWWTEQNPGTTWLAHDVLPTGADKRLLELDAVDEQDPERALGALMGEQVGE